MRGRAALRLVESVIASVRPHLPAGVREVRAALGLLDALLVWAVPVDVTDTEGYGFLRHERTFGAEPGPDGEPRQVGGSMGFRGPAAPFGIGSWLPFMPSAWRMRQDVECALDLVQSAVEAVAGPWPGPGALTKSRVVDRTAYVWFEDPSGRPLSPEIRVQAT